jgi:glycosyltransferase 2 family protein
VKLFLRWAVSLGALTWLATRVDWQHLAATARGVEWGWWLAAFVVFLATQLTSGLRWQWLARPLGFTQSIGRFTELYFVGMFFNLFLPTSVGGDAARAVYLNAGSGRGVAAALTVFVDRLSGLLVLLLLACLASLVSPVPLRPEMLATVWAAAGCALVGLAAVPVLSNALSHVESAGGRGSRFLARLGRGCGRLREALVLYRSRPRLLAATMGLSLVVQVANVALVALVGRSIGVAVPFVYYGVAVPMVTLLTLLPSINGMGVREAGTALFLAAAGVPEEAAVTLSFLWFGVQAAASLVGAVVYLFGRFPRMEGQAGEAAVDHRAGEGRAGQPAAAGEPGEGGPAPAGLAA